MHEGHQLPMSNPVECQGYIAKVQYKDAHHDVRSTGLPAGDTVPKALESIFSTLGQPVLVYSNI